MSDLIDRQAAIDKLQKEINEWTPPFDDVMGAIRCGVRLARNIIEDLPSAQPHWIPCSERLPEAEYGESDNVLTTCIYKDAVDGYRSVKTLYYNGGVWCYPTGETFEGKVLAWMSLPEPYGGEGDE